MKSEEFCDTCHYRKVCDQRHRQQNDDCPTYRPDFYWGIFDPDTVRVKHAD